MAPAPQVETGYAHPLGASYDGDGTNFALFSAHAERVELCLYDAAGEHETARVDLEQSHDVWHAYLPGVGPGTAYGYRVHGPYQLHAGLRFNPHKLLLDPYARQLTGRLVWHAALYGYNRDARESDLSFDQHDNAAYVPKAVVVGGDRRAATLRRPRVPWHETVIYEAHVRGFTMLHPEVPESLRGTFAGLARPEIIDYVKSLGITSVELLPVQAFLDEPFLVDKGLVNYWGYNTLNFFVPQQAYLGDAGIDAFREFVDRYHDAGLEVILDVVYNHTAEGNHLGPTLSYRGIDNISYYQLSAGDRRFYVNDSGTGNTLNIRHPRVLQLVLDSLRYWAADMGVDGFRFDLASVLGRDERGFNPRAAFFQALQQDPVLAGCKLIAEPWDLGPDGYQLGNYPTGFSEWNDRFRDTARRFWRGDPGQLPELARRLHGSADLFEHRGRKPHASINYVASHDGFTLRDLVSYNQRHNQANLEDNNDGHLENFSSNYGVEGPTTDPEIDRLRWRQQRNLLATVMVAQGVPMLLAGDEFGRSQRGNNNAYCQDNPINWIDWSAIDAEGRALTEFTGKLIALRRRCPLLQADQFRHQSEDRGEGSIHWFNSEGHRMLDTHWHERENLALGYLISENGFADGDAQRMLVLFNAAPRAQEFVLPADRAGAWRRVIDSDLDAPEDELVAAESGVTLAPRSLQIFSADGAGTETRA